MSKVNLFVVDDDKGMVRFIEDHLKRMDYNVIAVESSGGKALEKIAASKPDLVLVNIRLRGDPDGIETAEQIKNLYSIPVIYLTDKEDEELFKRAKISKPFGYVLKPVKEQELRLALEAAFLIHESETKQRENERKYRQIIEETTEVVYTADAKGNFTYMNPTGIKFTGYTIEEILGMNFTELVSPSWQNKVRAFYQQQFLERTGNTIFEFPIVTRMGEEKWVEQAVRLLREGDWVIGFQAIVRDITEHKKAVEALRESEELYKTLVETLPDSVTMMDLDGHIIFASPQTAELYGIKDSKQLLGKNAFLFIVPEDRKRAEKNAMETLEKGVIRNVEYTFIRADDSQFAGEMNIALVRDANGNPKAFITTCRDITERKQANEALKKSEEKYRLLINVMNDGFAVVDDRDVFVLVNPRMCEILGCKHESDIIGRSIFEFIPQDQHELIKAASNRRRAGVSETLEISIRRFNGEMAILRFSSAPLFNEQGTYIGASGVITDLTEKKWMEKVEASLYAISEAAYSTKNLDELYAAIHSIVMGLMPAENFFIALAEPATDEIRFLYLADAHTPPGKSRTRKRGKGLTEIILDTGKSLLLDHNEYMEMVYQGEIEIHGEPPIQWVGVPMKTGSKTIGVLAVQTYTKNVTLSESHKRILEFVSKEIVQAINRKRAEAEREQLIIELREALDNIKTLKGLVPICSWCHKIRDDEGYWQQVDAYVEAHSEVEFSHGICPECAEEHLKLKPHVQKQHSS